jgi:putative hydrolase of the HAD superfamily
MLLLILAQLDINIENISTAQIDDFLQQLETAFWQFPPFFIEDDLEKILAKAQKKHISLSIFSNTGLIRGRILRQFFKEKGLSKYFDFQLYSDELYLSKPTILAFETIFAYVLRLKNIEKQNIAHVGDNLVADVKGANDFGFKALHYEYKLLKMNDLLEKNDVF